MRAAKYTVKTTAQFKKDYKRAMKRGLEIALLEELISKLARGEALAPHYRDHALSGRWASRRECHIASDWLHVYRIAENVLVLTLSPTGPHSDLFGA
ncbi:type II toxin-antitoxin system YafQ family toxin [Selenomonas sp. F0473]|uniref:type II toxin-antitoxin system YafQ family toxin n=1 Tax=Selenomonas sp. F0473 TaxID=999423 RepID=UPI00029E065E|nr:type II toxin-antitoxin system YafQ family toxin [Selenomonas sp. F0473]EKU71000.1 RelE/StbE family addiction module toxin [Selenomonas sp. F0473]